MEFFENLKNQFTILDGAMGTMLQQKGLQAGERPEILSITSPKTITEIHSEYIKSGADIVYTNTFGANSLKLAGTGYSTQQIISASIAAAKKAAENTSAKIALDVGPLGELLEPSGTLRFEEAYDLFKEQMIFGEQYGADLIVIETMTDLYEMKAAVLAAKENCSLPVFATMSFELNHRTFTGCTPLAMALTLEGLGADAIGINCSLGPHEIYPIVKELVEVTSLPVIVKANAGLPNLQTGGYDISAEEFAIAMARIADLGVTILGGCCGTTPETIAKIKEKIAEKQPVKRDFKRLSAVCTPTNTVVIDGVKIIGERINPTGKKRFKQALIDRDIDYILSQAIEQTEAGAHILDVNVGLPDIDEREMMVTVVKQLQSVTDAPLQIDSSDHTAVEAALRIYNGKPIVNSVNGEQKVLDRILPLIKKYGAAVVGLCLDETGIPNKAEDRFIIAKRIVDVALSYGIPKEDVYIDCLTLTASVQQAEVTETLKAMQMVKEQLGCKTVLGVSNISFGLPNRELINRSFLLLAMANGLDLPIINPNIAAMTETIAAFNVLSNRDKNSAEYIEKFANYVPSVVNFPVISRIVAADAPTAADIIRAKATDAPAKDINLGKVLDHAIAKGLKEEARAITAELLKENDEFTVINQMLIPALDLVGTRFEKGEIFLPQLLQSAGAAQSAFEEIKRVVAEKGSVSVSKGKIVLATVKGDIHDIGKNIVKVILENYGYQVIDLGRDVPIESVVEAVKKFDVHLVGLSALMTTTLKSMEATISALRAENCDCKIMVGGAVLTEDYALKIGADFYAKDAKQSADIAKKVLG